MFICFWMMDNDQVGLVWRLPSSTRRRSVLRLLDIISAKTSGIIKSPGAQAVRFAFNRGVQVDSGCGKFIDVVL